MFNWLRNQVLWFTIQKKLVAVTGELESVLRERDACIQSLEATLGRLYKQCVADRDLATMRLAAVLAASGGTVKVADELAKAILDFDGYVDVEINKDGEDLVFALRLTPAEVDESANVAMETNEELAA